MFRYIHNIDRVLSPLFYLTAKNSFLFGVLLSILLFFPLVAGEPGEKPAWKVVIAPADEPGERMIISGSVYAVDSITPRQGIKVYVYHADAKGYYSKKINSPRNPRLNGTMVTDSLGRYEYETIRPGPYPEGGFPAHIHYLVTDSDGVETRFELLFEGDPNISDVMRRRESVEGGFIAVRPLEKNENGVWVGTFDLILRE